MLAVVWASKSNVVPRPRSLVQRKRSQPDALARIRSRMPRKRRRVGFWGLCCRCRWESGGSAWRLRCTWRRLAVPLPRTASHPTPPTRSSGSETGPTLSKSGGAMVRAGRSPLLSGRPTRRPGSPAKSGGLLWMPARIGRGRPNSLADPHRPALEAAIAASGESVHGTHKQGPAERTWFSWRGPEP